MNKRLLRLSDYGISKKRYLELKAFCEQYPEWKEELRFITTTIKSKVISDMPMAPHGNSDATGDLAVRRALLDSKCKLIEDCAFKSCNGEQSLADILIKSICYEIPFYDVTPIFVSRSTFYDYRRLFFTMLDKEKT